jgi:glycosyltransferase involved in cell wall biosynthesis
MNQPLPPLRQPSASQLRVMPVCECFDDRSFGLSRAAVAFTTYLHGVAVPAALSLKRLSGKEPAGLTMVSFDSASMMRMPSRGIVDHALANAVDIVHFHGVWTMAIKQIARLKELGIGVIVSPHGMLEDYIINHHRLRKWLFSTLIQRSCLRQADVIHALNDHEAECIRKYVGTSAPIVVIPNGVEAVEAADALALADRKRRFLYMGRLHEKKRLDLLLEAWSQASIAEQAELVIAGSGEGAYAERIIARCHETLGVRYVGYLAGADRAQAQAQSTFGILTSLSEGQPLSVLESLACGRPCIATSGCRMPMIERERLGWLGDEVAAIADAMRSACYLPDSEYRAMARRCRTYVKDNHDWHANAHRMGDTYRQVMVRGLSRTHASERRRPVPLQTANSFRMSQVMRHVRLRPGLGAADGNR